MTEPIRSVRFSDAPELFRILQDSEAVQTVPIGPRWRLPQIEEECRGEGLVFQNDAGVPKAFILYRDTGAAWEITFLATEPESRGQGLMKALIENMLKRRPQERPIWLEVHTGNVGARRLYEQQGFEVVGERPKYYADGGTAVLYNYG